MPDDLRPRQPELAARQADLDRKARRLRYWGSAPPARPGRAPGPDGRGAADIGRRLPGTWGRPRGGRRAAGSPRQARNLAVQCLQATATIFARDGAAQPEPTALMDYVEVGGEAAWRARGESGGGLATRNLTGRDRLSVP